MTVKYWSYIESYLKTCCATIQKPCISVGIIRFVEDVATLILRDLKVKGVDVSPNAIKRELVDDLMALRYMGVAQVVDGSVVNFREDVIQCDVLGKNVAKSNDVGKTAVSRRKTLLDYF